ncbi:MAG: glycosyltransferase [Cyanophyceae cyanobacterium]
MSDSTWLGEFSDEINLPDWVINSSQRRRLKAFFVLAVVWGFVALLHLIPVTRWTVTGFATLVAIHASRIVAAPIQPLPPPLTLQTDQRDPAQPDSASGSRLPKVSILVPAKNESKVLPHLLDSLAQVDYPDDHLDVWVIDDASTDETPTFLAARQQLMPTLHVHRRAEGSGGGKSGALNEVLPLTQGEIILVCDADAGIPVDFLRQTLPLFAPQPNASSRVGAVQVRKAVVNADHNLWTRRQAAEMVWDARLQSGKVAIGGIGELRGNGQLVRRDVLDKCGGWNEATITDDLDLTLRLHLTGVDIACTPTVTIEEEAVTTWAGLWRQRSRWAEGGYQRYLDYWPGILSNQMGSAKTLDLLVFFGVQYLLPMAVLPDLLWTLTTTQSSALLPMGIVFTAISWMGFYSSLRQIQKLQGWPLWRESLTSVIYMMHWLPVMAVVTARMCVQPKRLRWVKTIHHGRA